jgi:WD40 repeat protein
LTTPARAPETSNPEDDRTNPTDKGSHSELYVLNYETGELAAGAIPLMAGKVTPCFDSLGSRIAAHAPDGSVRVYAIPGMQEVLPALSQTAEPALGRTVTGIVSCRFARQDRWICAMDKLGALRLWDSATGSLLHPPMFHEGDVSDFGISPDGTRIAVSTEAGFYLWDSVSGQCINRDTSADSSTTWRFTRDGHRVLLQISREKWKLLDAISGRLLRESTEKAGAPEPFAWNAESEEVLLTPAAGQFLRRFDAWKGTPLSDPIHIPGYEPLLAIEMVSSNRIGTCSLEGVGMLWSPSRAQFLQRIMTHAGPVQVASFSPDGDFLLTASADQTARIWNVASGNPVGAGLVHSNRVYSACWSPDGKRVATGSWDGTARLWDARSGSPLGAPMNTSNYVFHVEFDPAGRRLLVTGEDPLLRVYDAFSGLPIPEFQPPSGAFVYHASFSPDGRRILTRPWREDPQVWDATQGSLLLSLPESDRNTAYGPSVQRVAISRDGRWAAAASPSGYATLWDLQNGQFRARLLHAKLVRGVVFSPDSRRVLTFAEDRTARVWQVPSGRPVTPPLRHAPGPALGLFQGDGIKTGTFSPDGKRVATGGNDGAVRLWDAATGLPLAEPFRHAGPVLHVEFSRDGRFLASASADGTARVWEVALAEGPVPPWLIELADCLSTRKLLVDGSDQKVSPVRLWPISQSLTNAASSDRYERWGSRFFGHALPALAP